MRDTTIAELVERLALPPDGVDLRAELDALQSARVSQALERSGGDMARAAKLLRMTRLDLLRLEQRLSGRDEVGRARPRFEPPPLGPTAALIPRIQDGVEFVSAAAVRRLAEDGLTERQIASRVGCNAFIVEKILREDTERRVRELDAERIAPSDIASRLRVPLARVRRILAGEAPRRRPRARAASVAQRASASQTGRKG